jgi:methylenetetrahydrofolate dehydrogenase (NAD+)
VRTISKGLYEELSIVESRMASTVPPVCKVILAGSVAKGLLEEVKEGLSRLEKKPLLVGFLANEDPAAQMYADWSLKTCVEK